MGSFANTLFTIMLGWIQTAASAIWSAFTTENGGSFFQWIGKNWILLAVILCLTGMALDLCIYFFRWRPMQVWKSFFRRLRHGNDDSEEPEQITSKPVPAGRLFRNEEKAESDYDMRFQNTVPEQDEFSRWMNGEPEPVPETETIQKRTIITGAGYSVPMDSPYRRPAATAKTDVPAEALPEEQKTEEYEAKPEIMTQRKRRRRVVVSDLFTDPEEELYQFETPQQLIDKNKASHQPVYPRNWKKDEGENE